MFLTQRDFYEWLKCIPDDVSQGIDDYSEFRYNSCPIAIYGTACGYDDVYVSLNNFRSVKCEHQELPLWAKKFVKIVDMAHDTFGDVKKAFNKATKKKWF